MEKYTPKFQINDKIYFQDEVYFVRGMMAKECSHPYPEIEYCLSELENRPCTSNVSNKTGVEESRMLSLEDYKSKKIEEARRLLISEGVILQA